MIVILGLIILVAALVVGVAGVLSNAGSAHALTHGFAVLGYHVTGSTGTLFLYGIVVGALAMLGLSLLLAGARRTSRRGRASRRDLEQSRRETAAASQQRDDLLNRAEPPPIRRRGRRRVSLRCGGAVTAPCPDPDVAIGAGCAKVPLIGAEVLPGERMPGTEDGPGPVFAGAVLVLVALAVLDCADAVSELAPFLGQFEGLVLPLVEALGIGPVNVGASDAIEGRDTVTRTSASPDTLRVHNRYPCVGLARGFIGSGERAREAGLRHCRPPATGELRRRGASFDSCRKPPGGAGLSRVALAPSR